MPAPAFETRLDRLLRHGWTLSTDKRRICRDYRFADFRSAFALMQQIATQAEALNHHPDWSNSYNQLHICLSTHSAQALTEKDLDLAEFIESLVPPGQSADA